MSTGIGRWLRQQREARGWARREMAHRLLQAAEAVSAELAAPIYHRSAQARHLTEQIEEFTCQTSCARSGVPHDGAP